MLNKPRAAVCFVVASQGSYGTGVLIRKDVVLTAAHVEGTCCHFPFSRKGFNVVKRVLIESGVDACI